MIEAGAQEIPEDVLLEAFELAHREIIRLCEAQEDLRSQIGKPKYLDPEVTQELEQQVADRIRAADPGGRAPRVGRGRRGAHRRALADALDGLGRGGHPPPHAGQVEPRADHRQGPPRSCGRAGLRAVRRRPSRAHRRGAGLEGAEVREAAPALRADRGDRRPRVPGRSRNGRRRRSAGEGRPHAPVRQARGRVDLQGDRAQEDRDRQEPARRSRPGGDPPDRVRGGRQPAHARLGALPARADADHVAAHARHREGGSADRRPLPRGGASVHAPLQLPAVLGRGDGLHARPEAPRHRPRCARAAGARAGDPDAGRLPVHDPHRLGDARVERLVVDGLGLRLDAVALRRRRAAEGAGLGHRDGPRQGRRRLRDPDGHPGRGGPPGRHGLQGRRVPQRDHRAPDGHQDHRRHAADHERRARAGEAGSRRHPRQDARGDSRSPGRSCGDTRRASRRSRSTPSTSGW